MQYLKYYKIIILSSLTLCLLSCSSNSDNRISYDSPQKYEIQLSTQKIITVLSIKENNDTVYLRQSIREASLSTMLYGIVDKVNSDGKIVEDTVYGPTHYSTKETKKIKIPLEQTMVEYAKKMIVDQLKIEHLYSRSPVGNYKIGTGISIEIFSTNERLKVVYPSHSGYEDISLEFKLFIDSLISKDIRFKEYLDEKYFFNIE